MEQRRFAGNSHWYHETQSSRTAQAAPLVPEAAEIEDRFLLGLAPACQGELNAMLRQAQPALLASRDLYHLLFPAELTTSLTHTLSLYDRLSTALTVAQVTGIQRLCNHYAARLNPLSGPDSSRESNRRLTQITEYARQLASQPTLVDAAALHRLEECGLSAPDIVTFTQIIGFVSYQARVAAGLHALLALPVRWMPGVTIPPDAEPFTEAAAWRPLLAPVELRYATALQLEALTWCQSQSHLSESAWLLAHDASALNGWSRLLNALDATPEGVLAAAVTARINGSAACFARFEQIKLHAALRQGVDDALNIAEERDRAIIQVAAQLTRSPERFNAAHLQPLKATGMNVETLFNVFQHIAQASWQNRLMQSLGTVQAG
ncbi:oxidoreductase [Erwinia sp. 9145]|uniref:CMD domain-containing protein n=1 Tax=Erwinia sp. 9145 TaxID=1500895 RepID=UPI000557A68D|nr:oxidoreductase [Erwinia sp. 9145]